MALLSPVIRLRWKGSRRSRASVRAVASFARNLPEPYVADVGEIGILGL